MPTALSLEAERPKWLLRAVANELASVVLLNSEKDSIREWDTAAPLFSALTLEVAEPAALLPSIATVMESALVRAALCFSAEPVASDTTCAVLPCCTAEDTAVPVTSLLLPSVAAERDAVVADVLVPPRPIASDPASAVAVDK
jgi:hypothetical protein